MIRSWSPSNPDDEYLTLRTLRQIGINAGVEVARTGAEALALLFRGERRYRAMLRELALPVVSGGEVLRTIRRSDDLSALPVFVLTGSPVDEDHLTRIGIDASAFLLRPIDPRVLSACLGQPPSAWPAASSRTASLTGSRRRGE